MTIPPIRKWRWPRVSIYRARTLGWQIFVDIHPNHNPILIVSRWVGEWHIEAFERVLYRSTSR